MTTFEVQKHFRHTQLFVDLSYFIVVVFQFLGLIHAAFDLIPVGKIHLVLFLQLVLPQFHLHLNLIAFLTSHLVVQQRLDVMLLCLQFQQIEVQVLQGPLFGRHLALGVPESG